MCVPAGLDRPRSGDSEGAFRARLHRGPHGRWTEGGAGTGLEDSSLFRGLGRLHPFRAEFLTLCTADIRGLRMTLGGADCPASQAGVLHPGTDSPRMPGASPRHLSHDDQRRAQYCRTSLRGTPSPTEAPVQRPVCACVAGDGEAHGGTRTPEAPRGPFQAVGTCLRDSGSQACFSFPVYLTEQGIAGVLRKVTQIRLEEALLTSPSGFCLPPSLGPPLGPPPGPGVSGTMVTGAPTSEDARAQGALWAPRTRSQAPAPGSPASVTRRANLPQP